MEVKVEDQSSKKVSSFLQLMTTSLSWRKALFSVSEPLIGYSKSALRDSVYGSTAYLHLRHRL